MRPPAPGTAGGGGPSRPPRALRLARAWIRALAPVVPSRRRAAWRAEWEGEVAARWEQLCAAGRGDAAAARDVALRTAGALPDALYLRTTEVGMRGWTREIRFAGRALRRRPGLTGVALVTLALGIGANAALFSVVHAVLLRPLPWQEPDRLVRLWGTENGVRELGGTVSYPDVRDVGERARSLAAVAAFDEWRPALGGGDAPPEVVYGGTVDASFFDVLGVEPAVGRFFRPDEQGEGREPRLVLGHALWQRRFGGDPGVVGRAIAVNGVTAEVIGVLPADFETPGLEGASWGAPEIWRTVAAPPPFRSGRSWGGVARLADGVTLEAAQAEVDAVAAALAEEFPEENRGYGVALVPLRDQLLGDADTVLGVLLGAVALVLLIACANVANLLLVRSAERRGELDLRVALGASRVRVAATAVLEGLMLSVAGAALGLALAHLALDAAAPWIAAVLPRAGAVALDAAVVVFTAGLALLTGVVFGLAPALAALRAAGPGAARRARSGSPGREGARLRRALVAAEVALSVTLLVGAGVLLRSLDAVYGVDLGLEREGVLTVDLHSASFFDLSQEEALALYGRVMQEVGAVPGVRAAGAINILPLTGGFSCDGVRREDLPPEGEGRCAEIRTIFPGTLEALGVPLLRGRTLGPADHRLDAPPVVVVSREMAESFWPGEDPLGTRVAIHGESWEVVGVAGDMRHFGPLGESRPQAYLNAPRDPWGGVAYGFQLVVRGGRDAGALAPALRAALASAAPDLAVASVRSLDDLLDRSVAAPRFRALLLGAFAALAVLLAVVGLTGVVAYSVRQRTREIGVRVALGARPSEVSGMVVREGAVLVAAGAAAGLVLALLGADVLESMVYGVDVRDPWVVVGAPLLLGAVALLACWLPARRAARVDPVRALTVE